MSQQTPKLTIKFSPLTPLLELQTFIQALTYAQRRYDLIIKHYYDHVQQYEVYEIFDQSQLSKSTPKPIQNVTEDTQNPRHFIH